MNELFEETQIEGCLIFKNRIFEDQRGFFSKVFSEEIFESVGKAMPVAEVYYSNSHKNVLRGMHFQTPPYEHTKVVSCLAGRILDVVLDLRKESKSFGQAISFELTPQNERTVVIPKGCAHGFYSFEDNSLVAYLVETVHNKAADQGVRWDSFGFHWPCKNPIISERDSFFKSFTDFLTPF